MTKVAEDIERTHSHNLLSVLKKAHFKEISAVEVLALSSAMNWLYEKTQSREEIKNERDNASKSRNKR